MNGLPELLQEIGLNFRESSIYTFLLQKGEASASIIARELAIKRSSAYVVLENLQQRGLIKGINHNKIQVYNAVEPQVFLERFRKEQKQTLDRLNNISKQLEESSVMDSFFYQKPKVHFYMGEAGIKQIMEDVLKEKCDLKALITSKFQELITVNYPSFILERSRKGMSARVAYPYAPLNCPDRSFNADHLRESKHVDGHYDRGMNFIIYGRKTALIFLKEKFGLIVESSSMNESFNQYFEELWLTDWQKTTNK